MKPIKSIFVNMLFICLACFPLFASVSGGLGGPEVRTSVGAEKAFVGDVIDFEVRAELPKGAYLSAGRDIVFSDFDVVYSSVTHLSADPNVYILNYGLSAYETGAKDIEPVGISYIDPLGKKEMFFTDNIKVNIESVLPPQPSEMKDIKPLKVLSIKTEHIAAAAALVLLMLVLFVFIIKDFVSKEPIVKKTETDPKTQALENLSGLFNSGIIQKGDSRLFYYHTAEILRTYISKKFSFNAMEMTTTELIKKLSEIDPAPEVSPAEIKEYFKLFDLARYAGYKPLKNTVNESYEKTREFIQRL